MGAAARFTQTDLKRAVKGVEAAGVRVGRVEIDRSGKIVIISAGETPPEASNNPWDSVLKP